VTVTLLAAVPVASVLAVRQAVLGGDRPVGTVDGAQYATWIETRAAGVFDPATPQLRGLHVRYRVDAHVLLPLGFTSLEIWSRPDVGVAIASYRDCAAGAGDVLRAYELFSASKPERARGLDRLGFFREAIRLTPVGPSWTAYFGAMTWWPEQTYNDAKKALDGPRPNTYEAIDGFAGPLETTSSVFRVSTEQRMTNPGELWAALRPQLETRPPRYRQQQAGSQAKPLPALAFLGALQASLRSAAVHRDRPLRAGATQIAFTHNGTTRRLELVSASRDPSRGRPLVGRGLVHDAADVFQLRFRILNPDSDPGEFRLWAELPARVRDDPQTPPVAPVAWELEVRSYLRLYFERTN
jgi:hypothetical protein